MNASDRCVPAQKWFSSLSNLLAIIVLNQVSARARPIEKVVSDAYEQRDTFWRDGFMILRSVFSREEINACHDHLDHVIWAEMPSERPPNIHGHVTDPGVFDTKNKAGVSRKFYLHNASSHIRNQTYRLSNIHTIPSPNPWHQIMFHPAIEVTVMEVLGIDLGHVSGLMFERGTQQSLHDDTWYGLGGCVPGGMVGVWYALDDVDDANGPLIYVPGSHLRPEMHFNLTSQHRRSQLQMITDEQRDIAYHRAQEEGKRFQKRAFHARAGDVAIWHERLLHGGGSIRDWSRSRLSLVVHFKDYCDF